jgi:hypothetical protein
LPQNPTAPVGCLIKSRDLFFLFTQTAGEGIRPRCWAVGGEGSDRLRGWNDGGVRVCQLCSTGVDRSGKRGPAWALRLPARRGLPPRPVRRRSSNESSTGRLATAVMATGCWGTPRPPNGGSGAEGADALCACTPGGRRRGQRLSRGVRRGKRASQGKLQAEDEPGGHREVLVVAARRAQRMPHGRGGWK